jgi:hypothetical protein
MLTTMRETMLETMLAKAAAGAWIAAVFFVKPVNIEPMHKQ